MRIHIKLFSFLRELVNRKEDILEVDDKLDVGDLVPLLKERYGQKFCDYVISKDGGFQHYIKVMVNGRDIEFLEGLKTPLKDGDILQIIPPVRGGLTLRMSG